MGSISDFLENELLDHILGNGVWAQPGNLYIGLHTTPCTDATHGTEVSGGSYARKVHNAWDVAAIARAVPGTGGLALYPFSQHIVVDLVVPHKLNIRVEAAG